MLIIYLFAALLIVKLTSELEKEVQSVVYWGNKWLANFNDWGEKLLANDHDWGRQMTCKF